MMFVMATVFSGYGRGCLEGVIDTPLPETPLSFHRFSRFWCSTDGATGHTDFIVGGLKEMAVPMQYVGVDSDVIASHQVDFIKENLDLKHWNILER